MVMVQTQLERPTGAGIVTMLTWLPQDRRVRPGSIISLERGGERWRVTQQYATMDSTSIQKGWGLDLPPSTRTER